MTAEEFSIIASKLKAAFPRDAIPDQITYDLWKECLIDFDFEWMNIAIVDIIKNSRYCPKIYEVINKYNSIDKRSPKEKYADERGLQ